jgi:hypothetical protein
MRGPNTARVDEAPTESPWLAAHRALSRLAKQRANADREEGRCLVAALRAAAHVHLGFGSFSVRRALVRLQLTIDAGEAARRRGTGGVANHGGVLERGELSWSAVRELTRVAVTETECEWLALAETKTVRQLEQLVAGAKPGDLPSSPRDPSLVRHVLRFEVSAETLAPLSALLIPGPSAPWWARSVWARWWACAARSGRRRERARTFGSYTLDKKMGEGGMAIVYRASHAFLRRPAAIKLLPPERTRAWDLERFEWEVQLTSQLTHANTISIYDYGCTADGALYYAMEYVDGHDLETWSSARARRSPIASCICWRSSRVR